MFFKRRCNICRQYITAHDRLVGDFREIPFGEGYFHKSCDWLHGKRLAEEKTRR